MLFWVASDFTRFILLLNNRFFGVIVYLFKSSLLSIFSVLGAGDIIVNEFDEVFFITEGRVGFFILVIIGYEKNEIRTDSLEV